MQDTVLVIEDSKTMNNIISKKLESLGFKVDSAFTLKEADELLGKNVYELIILDLHLPDGEGTDLIMDVQSVSSGTKIIVLTSTKDEYLREELFKYGILDYIVKDKNLYYSIEEVIRVIKHVKEKERNRILAIDDSRFIQKQIKRVLEPRNYIVESAFSGEEGIEKIKSENFDLIILDLELPDMHGTKVLEMIRSDESLVKLPVIVLSGTADAEHIRYILKNGANDYLKKPFVFEEFILKVDLWIDYYKQGKELAEKTKQLEELTKNLEKRVEEETKKNIEKDRMLFIQSRFAQMGEMLSMIAHQWKQPLNSLSALLNRTYLRYQMNKNQIDEETMKFCHENATLHIQNMSETIHSFMNFFKPDKEKEVFDLKETVRKSIKLIKSAIESKGIKIITKLENDVKVLGYPNEFGQVVINIVNNAKDAILEKNPEEKEIYIRIYKDENKAILTIEDTAGGIPEDVINKIFEPYFSTKEKVGTGLGLYIAKTIIEQHMDGKIYVENTDKGAKFYIELPTV